MLRNRTILVTGVGGYIGSILSYSLLKKGYNIIGIDNFEKGFHEPLNLLQSRFGKQRLIYENVDLNGSLDKIFRANPNIETVIHVAGSMDISESVKNPEKYFQNNSYGTYNLIKRMIEFNVRNIIFSSTCTIYGETGKKPIEETHSTLPINPYGGSKLIAEKILEFYGNFRGINYVILRYFNVCGASEDALLGDSQKPSKLLVHNAVKGALGIHKFVLDCQKVNTTDGTPIRDYIDIIDIVNAHYLTLKFLEDGGKNQVFNLGAGKGYSVLQIVEAVRKITSSVFQINKAKKPREGECSIAIASIKKAEKILGWTPKKTLEDSIISTIKWYTKRPLGWKF
ncbi:MAG: UDP-glucose 4-epimerase GalE [Candidatus Levybacteria bacterium]|nr:UDP-glucose 4-epimerase GalE [Candidatus Levybacteria bacterium]